jgi:hypothetical protein
MRRLTLLITGFTLLVSSGCGSAAPADRGSSSHTVTTSSTETLSSSEYAAAKQRFIDEEEVICHRALAGLSRWRARIGSLTHVPPARAARTAELIEEEITLEDADFARMEPPAEPSRDVPQISEWLRSLRFAAAYAGELAEVLSAGKGESAEARAAYRKMIDAKARNRKLATNYGFNYCSRLQ